VSSSFTGVTFATSGCITDHLTASKSSFCGTVDRDNDVSTSWLIFTFSWLDCKDAVITGRCACSGVFLLPTLLFIRMNQTVCVAISIPADGFDLVFAA